MRVALVGCGNIAARYAARIVASPGLTLVGATDLAIERAAALVAEFGGAAYTSLEALLADETVDTVVNLTVPEAHATVRPRAWRRASTSTRRSRWRSPMRRRRSSARSRGTMTDA